MTSEEDKEDEFGLVFLIALAMPLFSIPIIVAVVYLVDLVW